MSTIDEGELDRLARCHKCNGTGTVSIRSRDGAYAFPGPVPDDARGYADADCWYCDSGPPPAAPNINQRGGPRYAIDPFAPAASTHDRQPRG